MPITEFPPVEARVRWDRRRARPTRVRWQDHEVGVVAIAAQRDELAAYPADRGPRVTFLVETDAGRASLVYDGRRRRWYVVGLEGVA